ELEALPGPVAQLVAVVDVGHAEEVAGDVIGKREPDLLDDAELATALPGAERVVDDLLRAVGEPRDRAVGEARRDQAARPGGPGAVGREGVAGEMDVPVGALGLTPRDLRRAGRDLVVAEQEPLTAAGIDAARALSPQLLQAGIRVAQVFGRARAEGAG